MKLFFRRFKGYLTVFLAVFLLFYLLINYVNLKSSPGKIEPPGHAPIQHKPAVEKIGENPEPVLEIRQDQEDIPNIIEVEARKPLLSDVKDAAVKQENVPIKETGEVKRYYAVDGNGRGSVNREVIRCSTKLEVEVIGSGFDRADFSYFLDAVPDQSNKEAFGGKGANKKPHYFMVYAMESEPHSGGGSTWQNADFYMWYNLNLSFPEPATYFDVHSHLPDLLAPPRVPFEAKSVGDLAPIAWVLSNCNAFNRREVFVKRLMQLIPVDSYGFCLRNKDTHTSQRCASIHFFCDHGNTICFFLYKNKNNNNHYHYQ